jgi:uncharacterized protein
MRIIIAAGTGMIGHALTDELRTGGHDLIILSRSPRTSNDPGVRLVIWDSRSPAGWGHLVEEADAIVNLAGENLGTGRWSARTQARNHKQPDECWTGSG